MYYLGNKQVLLILDNLEHLLDGMPLIERILQRAPGVKVLATSRAVLRLNHEWLLPLNGLTVPETSALPVRSSADYTAVILFTQRATRFQPDFALSHTTAPHVVRICRLVGGMPLGIELAAAWLRAIPLAEIAGEIQTNLDFLASSMQNESSLRHSMRAVFDRSWQMLDTRARTTLMRLSIFHGGFDRQAATEVADTNRFILLGLVDSSWLQLNADSRYDIHELARQYAQEKLEVDPSTANHAHALHSHYYALFADREGLNELIFFDNSNTLDSLLTELDNVRAGWRWAIEHQNFDHIRKYAIILAKLADAHGLYGEVVAEFEQVCLIVRKMLADSSLSTASLRQ